MAKGKSKNVALPIRAVFLTLVGIGIVAAVILFSTKFGSPIVKEPENTEAEKVSQEEQVIINESEETKHWKVYRHKKMGFSIKYPPDAVITVQNDGMVGFTKDSYWPGRGQYPWADIQILSRPVEDNDPVTALKQETSMGTKSFAKATVNNAYGIKITDGSGAEYDFYLNDELNKGPVVRLKVGSGKAGVDLSDVVLMLTTFRFER